MIVAGIDVGSVATKVVILGENDQLLTYVIAESEPRVGPLSEKLLNKALEQAHLQREDLTYIVGTGYGRYIVPFANDTRTEIMCHTLGVIHLFPTVRTIIDVGGQDSKVIRVDETGRVRNFVMNDKCAAGSGRFVEVMAQALEVPFTGWGEMVTSAPRRANISSYCTVFAESEAISLVSQGVPVNEILAGLCEATVTRICQMGLKLGEMEADVCFTGGVALNQGVTMIIQEKLGVNLLIPEVPQITGALGAAYLAKRLAMQMLEKQ